jgi:hypothetical protein
MPKVAFQGSKRIFSHHKGQSYGSNTFSYPITVESIYFLKEARDRSKSFYY